MIRGKLEPDGSKLYYVPMDAGFDGMVIDPATGDRAFCSDEDARSAGWRRPGETADGS